MKKFFAFPALFIVVAFACTNPSGDSTALLTNGPVPKEVLKLGEKTYQTFCAACHTEGNTTMAPAQGLLSGMSPHAILAALNMGKMRVQAEQLTAEEREAVAQYLTNQKLVKVEIPESAYTDFEISAEDLDAQYNHSGWGGDLKGSGFRTASQAGITPENVSSLELEWAFAFPNSSIVRSKPAIIGKWMIVGSQFGEVYALNRYTGQIGWTFQADAAIRGAISYTVQDDQLTAYFADYATNTYSVDIRTGELIWKSRAAHHPLSAVTGSVAVYDDIVYVPITSFEVISSQNPEYACCTSSGGVTALNAKTGEEIWKHRVIAEEAREVGKKENGYPSYGPSGAPVWASPTVDVERGLLYIGTGENYTFPPTNTSDAIQALDLKTGELVWNWQATANDTWNLSCPDNPNCPTPTGPDVDFGMAPILVYDSINQRDMLVAGQKSGVVHALLPETGEVLWQSRIGKGGALGGIHWGMATDGNLVYAANSDNVFALDPSDPSLGPTPGIYALNLQTGEQVWKTAPPPCSEGPRRNCQQSNSAAPTLIPGVVFEGDLNGFIRAYSSQDGTVLWEFDTVREYETVNGQKGMGGSIDGPGPVVADGMLYVNSGYSMFGEMPGNVLLAFKVKGN
ncbi:PQQ-binding-like beta-propeller repeat protein [Algoriphagus limi]|uniref:PQQ-binding-like beta-propeller repeat protein n=1 Tax=Algoriphagus limi TaxID=2975273 RepID=A0ABT2G6M3_9BACT|nr:PQQ-binding-like beta-propeller repeat protein [Algoriphagus limi]MCS5490903.1 PQQ-binding-like beta-propeller repeat protein [Algoriphagus limi]